jgi:ribosomal protein S18 acetylase RimI-like enzyme/RimJ/RimL family protein N-acetyltransferase
MGPPDVRQDGGVNDDDVRAGADAPEEWLREAARVLLAVARHEGLSSMEALGPVEGAAAGLRAGWAPGQEVLVALAPGVGAAFAELPGDANLDRVSVEAYVLPEHRRRGHGRRLLAAVTAAAGRRGRTAVEATWPEGGPGDAAASRLGALRRVQVERVSAWESSPQTLAVAEAARREATSHAADYELVAWEGRTPPDLVEGFGAALAAMADAPTGDSTWQHPPADAGAVHRRDDFVAAARLRHHVVAAVHPPTGAIAGFTDIVVWPGHHRGEQWDTGVGRAHRGHHLGLLVKAEMALRLAELEPALRHLHTWNAEENRHMLAVNDRLGWRPERQWVNAEGPLDAVLGDLRGGSG